MRRRILSLLLLSLAYWVNADIYGWQDGAGNRHYSDRPHGAAKALDIKPGYGFYTVKKVFDGDTLMLEDGRKIRLLGVNTPEIEHRNQPAQAGGEDAKHWLIEKLKNRKVRLESDAESADKYGRTLAHVFTDQKEHINLQLVEKGLASVNIYPPNLLYVEPLISAERKAQRLASRNPTISALIADVRSYRSRDVPLLSAGAKTLRSMILGNGQDRVELTFRGAEPAVVYVHADADVDLDLYVYD